VDEESVNIDIPEEALGVATKLKDIGTKWVPNLRQVSRMTEGMCREFKANIFALALEKYQKALRYLDQHPALPDDTSAELVESFRTTCVASPYTFGCIR